MRMGMHSGTGTVVAALRLPGGLVAAALWDEGAVGVGGTVPPLLVPAVGEAGERVAW